MSCVNVVDREQRVATGEVVDDGELIESECQHKVCWSEDRQNSCMVRSGEVLREYSEEDGKLWWAVYPVVGENGKDERHCVTVWDVEYGLARGQELWREYLETLAVGRYSQE